MLRPEFRRPTAGARMLGVAKASRMKRTTCSEKAPEANSRAVGPGPAKRIVDALRPCPSIPFGQSGKRSGLVMFLYYSEEVPEQIDAFLRVRYFGVELDSEYVSTVMSHDFNCTVA